MRTAGRWLRLLWLAGMAASSFGAEDPIPALRPPKAEIPPSFWDTYGWVCLLLALALAGTGALLIRRLRRPKPEIAVPPGVVARRGLEALREHPPNLGLVIETSRLVRLYLVRRFGFPPDELTTTELCRAVTRHPQGGPDLADDVKQFLVRCDELKFAPGASGGAGEVLPAALDLVERVEARLRPAAPDVAVRA